MKVVIHRGTHQIGGCITEVISSAGTKIIIDIGQNLPSIDGNERNEIKVEGLNTGNPNIDAIFVTHYHGDHIGLYNQILHGIPIYVGEIACNIYKILQNRLLKANMISKCDLALINQFVTFKIPEKIKIKDITITPIQVDHSAFDAYMFLIECDGKKLLHTGDFRTHGQRGKSVISALEKYVGDVDCLICEGTTLSRKDQEPMTEFKLQDNAKHIFKDNKYNFVMCSSTNIDRIATIHKATNSAKRLFICDKYQNEILKYVTSVARSNLYKFNYNVYTYGDNLISIMKEKGFVMLVRDNKISKMLMEQFPNSTFIYSQWVGYLNVKFKDYKHLQKFVPKDYIYLHTSGHASYNSIQQVCKTLNPKIIIPIHGECPEGFKQMRNKRLYYKNSK